MSSKIKDALAVLSALVPTPEGARLVTDAQAELAEMTQEMNDAIATLGRVERELRRLRDGTLAD